jgi:hypothetical protein
MILAESVFLRASWTTFLPNLSIQEWTWDLLLLPPTKLSEEQPEIFREKLCLSAYTITEKSGGNLI